MFETPYWLKPLFAKPKLLKRLLCYMLLFAVTASSFSGCWDRREIEQIGFILGAGFDIAEDGKHVRLTVQIPIPSQLVGAAGGGGGGGGGMPAPSQKPVWVPSSTGLTFFQASRNMAKYFSRWMLWGHNQILVIGENLARQGLSEFLDFVTRNREMSRAAWLVLARGDARSILTAQSWVDPIPVVGLVRHIEQVPRTTASTVAVSVNDFLRMSSSESRTAVLGVVHQGTRSARVQSQPPVPEINPYVTKLSGAAVVVNNRLAGFLDERETRGYLLTARKVKAGTVLLPSPTDPSKLITLNLVNSKTQIKTRISGTKGKERVSILVNTQVEANITEEPGTKLKLPQDLIKLEHDLSRRVVNDQKSVLEKSKRLKADVLGFADYIFIYLYNTQGNGSKLSGAGLNSLKLPKSSSKPTPQYHARASYNLLTHANLAQPQPKTMNLAP